MLYKRSTYALFCLHDSNTRDHTQAQDIFAFSVLTGRPEPLEHGDLEWLQRLPSSTWTSAEELWNRLPDAQPETWWRLAQAGLVLVEGSGVERLDELRRRHDQLEADAWNGISAVYHFMGRWQDANLDPSSTDPSSTDPNGADQPADSVDEGCLDAEAAAEFLNRHGQAPPHFHHLEQAVSLHPMPTVERSDGLWDALARRRTTRWYDAEKAICREDLSTILHYVFGCHGIAPMFDGVQGIKKTSPSGGGLHPIEIYPLVLSAEGLAPGLYHYNLLHHSLDKIEELAEPDARALANELTAGQTYTTRASVLFLMTARFFRNFWKYRRHEKAYGVLHMDAAHLSQTLYLVCAELGLGAFFTAAVNGKNIETRLGLDGFQEGALAICGCGHIASGSSSLEPRFQSFTAAPCAPTAKTG